MITQFPGSMPSFFSLRVSLTQSLSALRLGVLGGQEKKPVHLSIPSSLALHKGWESRCTPSLAVPTAFGSPGKSEWTCCLPYSCLLLPHPSIKAGNLPPPHSGLAASPR